LDSFEWNKIAGAVLASVLVVIGISNLGGILFHEEPLAENAYVVEGVVEEGAGTVVAEKEEEPVTPLPVLLAEASAEKGERVFKKCAACHSVNAADGNKVGPNLHGVVGAAVAHLDNFAYSDAFKAHGGTWTFAELDHYLENPAAHIPGNKMSFAGLRKPGDRADVILYMNQNSDNPLPLPEVEEEAAPVAEEEAAPAEAEEAAPAEAEEAAPAE